MGNRKATRIATMVTRTGRTLPVMLEPAGEGHWAAVVRLNRTRKMLLSEASDRWQAYADAILHGRDIAKTYRWDLYALKVAL